MTTYKCANCRATSATAEGWMRVLLRLEKIAPDEEQEKFIACSQDNLCPRCAPEARALFDIFPSQTEATH